MRARHPALVGRAYSTTCAILAPLLRCRLALARLDHRDWMYPTDSPHVTIPGGDPLRILIIGDAPAAGFGVRTHQLGVAAHLARQLAEATGRGVDMHINANLAMTARSVPEQIEAAAIGQHDAIILMLATNDAMALTPVGDWTRDMGRSLKLLRAAVPNAGFVTTMADIGKISRLSDLTRLICGKHAQVLNWTAKKLCTFSENELVLLDTAHSLDSTTYRTWANSILVSLLPAIEASAPGTPPAPLMKSRRGQESHDRGVAA